MAACTFFGHHDCPLEIEPMIEASLCWLIKEHGVRTFYVGNHGNFDRLVARCLRRFAQDDPNIQFYIVLAYLPAPAQAIENSLFPEGIEDVHPRYAISWRNRWMLQHSDWVITYVTHSFGGAARYTALAERQEKTVINIAKTDMGNHVG